MFRWFLTQKIHFENQLSALFDKLSAFDFTKFGGFLWKCWFLTIDFANIPCFRIASGDWKGFLRIWTIKDLLQETEQHLLSSYRKKKSKIEAQAQTALDMGLKAKFSSEIKIEPMEFVEHRSTYSHRNHITMAILDAFRVITCSRDQTVLIQDFSKMI